MERNLSKTDLSRKMGRAHTTIRTMLKSTSHQAYILYQLSVVLNHNFFSDLALWLPKEIPGREKLDDKRVAELEEQIRELKAENRVLLKLLEGERLKIKG